MAGLGRVFSLTDCVVEVDGFIMRNCDSVSLMVGTSKFTSFNTAQKPDGFANVGSSYGGSIAVSYEDYMRLLNQYGDGDMAMFSEHLFHEVVFTSRTDIFTAECATFESHGLDATAQGGNKTTTLPFVATVIKKAQIDIATL